MKTAIISILAILTLLIVLIAIYISKAKTFSWKIWLKMLFVKKAIKRLAKERDVDVDVKWMGAVRISPRNLAIWIKTDRDFERDQLREDLTFARDIYSSLLYNHYPADAIPQVGIEIESQERVNRECGGSWWVAMK